jgi:outer membrane biosynthesis protein TonB
MDSEGSSDQGARFQFIDISSSNARKEARAHVMREFMRQKREEQSDSVKATKKARKRTKRPVDQSSEALEVAKRKRVQQVIDGKQKSSPVKTESDSSASALQESSALEKLSHPDGDTVLVRRPSMRLSTTRSRSGSPQSMVDASRRDPFQSLPMWLDEEDRPLVDHCQLSLSTTSS